MQNQDHPCIGTLDCISHEAGDGSAREDIPPTAAQRQPVGEPGGLSAGAPPSNTAPATCIDEALTLLRRGIDSLYLSFYGSLSAEWHTRLSSLKFTAQSADSRESSFAQAPILEHLFEVKSRGSGKFAYVLVDNWYHLSIASAGSTQLPMVYVKVSSQALTGMTIDALLADLTAVISVLGSVKGEAQASRVDLCADFVPHHPIDITERRSLVTRARRKSQHSEGDRYSGCSIGLGGDLSARLYDKTLEMLKHPRLDLAALWRNSGWDGESLVWRLEFQARRPVLVSFNITGISSLLERLGTLWSYFTHDWLRLTIPDLKDNTQTRWPTHPLWLALAAVDWTGHVDEQRRRPPTQRLPLDKTLFVNGISAILSFMAREGITDWDEGVAAFSLGVQAFYDERSLRIGQSFEGYVHTAVAVKGRLFNTLQNSRTEGEEDPAVTAAAQAYRKAKDGE